MKTNLLLLLVASGLASLLFEVSAADPAAYALVALVVAGVALLAAWWPARRAERCDPTEALRAD